MTDVRTKPWPAHHHFPPNGSHVITEPLKFGGYLAYYHGGGPFRFGWAMDRDEAVADLLDRTVATDRMTG